MKKILAFFMFIVFSFSSFGLSAVNASNLTSINNSEKGKIVKEIVISKSELNKTLKGKKYIRSIDKIIKKYSNNKKALEKIIKRIDKALEKDISNKEVKNVLLYLNSKAKIELLNILEEEKNDIYKETISESDKEYIEEKIVSLQLNALDKVSGNLEILLEEFDDLTNVEETGDLEMELNLDYEKVGKVEGKLNFNNYSSKTSGFNSQVTGEAEAFLNAVISGEENEIKFHAKSMIDLISKDGNFYLLLEDFNVLEKENIQDLEKGIETIKEIAEKNEYIKFQDKQTEDFYKVLNSLNLEKVISDSKTTLSKPLVTAYKKEDNKYYLKPTKYACDKFKQLSNKFDPFNPKTCSEGQYKDLLETIGEAGTFYAEIDGRKTTINFEANENLGFEINKGHISFYNNQIDEIRYTIQEKNNLLFIDFKNTEKLDIIVREDSKNIVSFYSELDRYNKFEKIDFETNIESNYSSLISNIKLENSNIDGNIEIKDKSYNWETGEYKDSYKTSFEISGKQNYSNELEEIEVKLTGTDLENEKENLNGLFKYENKYLEFNLDYEDKGTKFNLESNGKLDRDNILDDLKFEILVENKDYSYNSETWEIEYTGEFKKVADIQINIENKNITGESIIYNDKSEEIIKITNSGNYSEDTFKLDTKVELFKDLIMYFIPDEEKVEVNYNLDFDLSGSKNNAEIFINVLFSDKEIGNFKVKNTGNRDYKKVEIKEPSNYIELEEALEK